MKRFFFHVVTPTSRYEDETGTMLPSLDDVLPHGSAIAKALTKHRAAHINVGCADDYIEVEDQQSTFYITLPFARLLNESAPVLKLFESEPIDLNAHRLARRYLRGLTA
jgi:hypothetical protein